MIFITSTPAAIYYVQTDQLDTPREVTRQSDNVQMWRCFSDPFGTTAPNQNPQSAGNFTYNLRFPGQIHDPQIGLDYNYFRDYDSAVGRYVESDPMLGPTRDLDGQLVFVVPSFLKWLRWLQPYAYVADQPLNGSDPKGLFWPLDFIKCIYYSNKVSDAAKKCHGECGTSSEKQIDFMSKYQTGSISDALFKCTCKNAVGTLCLNWLKSCGSLAMDAPYPKPTQIP